MLSNSSTQSSNRREMDSLNFLRPRVRYWVSWIQSKKDSFSVRSHQKLWGAHWDYKSVEHLGDLLPNTKRYVKGCKSYMDGNIDTVIPKELEVFKYIFGEGSISFGKRKYKN